MEIKNYNDSLGIVSKQTREISGGYKTYSKAKKSKKEMHSQNNKLELVR